VQLVLRGVCSSVSILQEGDFLDTCENVLGKATQIVGYSPLLYKGKK
jgi:hypothetical protein